VNDILRDLSREAMAEAVEANTIEFLLALGRAGGGEERRDAEVQWVIGGSPIAYHNCVVRAALPQEHVERAIQSSIAAFRLHGVPGSWHVGPSMRPVEIGDRLAASGFVPVHEPGMAIDLHALTDGVSAPEDLRIERISDDRGLDAWAHTLSLGFGEGEREALWVRDMYRRLGFSDAGAWHHYLGRLGGHSVATATVFLGAGVAGVYFISTVPSHRRRGIGAAITLAALRDARDRGYRVAVLGSSEMGYPVYRRLGFDVYCPLAVYEWQHV
jgi:GNAT superfamily N-acetyltransferase